LRGPDENVISEVFGEKQDRIGCGIDEICKYYVILNSWNIVRKGNYVLFIEGLRKDSRDHLRISSLRSYHLDRDDFQKVDGSYFYTFEQDVQSSFHLLARKTFTNGKDCDNIQINLTDEYGNEVFFSKDCYIEGVSGKELIEQKRDEYYMSGGCPEESFLDWLCYAIVNSKDDIYYIDRTLTMKENTTFILEVSEQEEDSDIFIEGSYRSQTVWNLN
jgi:hypothetical protein